MSAASDFSESASLDFVVRVQMKQFGVILDTRKAAIKVRASIEREILAGEPGAAVVLDFRSVRAVTVSFSDECFGRLLADRSTGYLGSQPMLAIYANEDVRDTIGLTLAHRKLALLHLGDPPELLGGDTILNQTLTEAWQLRKFTAGDLAGSMGLTPQAVNNRLKALVLRGALHRNLVTPPGGGKEFLYIIPESGRKRRRARSGRKVPGRAATAGRS